jgi:hypothetical protein
MDPDRIALEASDGRSVDDALRVREAAVEAGALRPRLLRRPDSAEP